MVHIREYLLSVTAAAILVCILRSLAGEKGTAGGILKLITGIFLTLMLIRPFANIRLREFALITSDILEQADAAAQEGADYARRAMARHISGQAEAYILDKATLYNAQITVQVTVSESDTPVPVGCIIRGTVSPYAKQQLSRLMEEELGIRKEAQQWISESS